jgi:phenylacetate-CoA ligase
MNVNEISVEEFSKKWNRLKPTLLFGHAHSIFILAEYVRDLAIDVIQPKGIIATSMSLLPHERKIIENVFRVKVFDRYGCEEVSLIASECEIHNGMHLNIEHLFIEFLDDSENPVHPGEPGKIVVTDLFNKAMPFIRYQVDDIGVPSIRKCLCGRGLPIMEKVSGRLADFLVKKDGSKVAGISLIENTITKISGIKQMQIIQESIDYIQLKIVPDTNFKQGQRDQLISYFKKIFFNNTTINIELVQRIESENSGKYRFSICKVITTTSHE